MGGLRFPLAARDRILLHLSEFSAASSDEGSYPQSLTQDGIAFRTGLGRAHVALALKSLREEGLVEEVKGRVPGEARRRKVYALSEPGRSHSRNLISEVMGAEVTVQLEGAAPLRKKLSEVSFVLPRKVSLIDLSLSVGEGALLAVGPNGLPAAPPEAEEGEGPVEELEMSGPQNGAESGPVESAFGEAQRPSAAGAFLGDERPTPNAGGLLSDYGKAAPAPAVPEGAPVPAEAARPATPWARRGQLAAVWSGALVLSGVFVWLSFVLKEELEPDFLIIYFLVMVTLQWVLVGPKSIPAGVRSELGIYIGGFMALYGGSMLFGPRFESLLWFTEGLLLLSTALLVHDLETDRRFQTAGASVGSFIIFISVQGMFLGEWALFALSFFWLLVGCLFVAARLMPQRAGYTAKLRAAAAISAGVFMFSIGLFLSIRELYAEGFVELLVGAVMVYYAAPKKKEEWNAVLIATTAVICSMVMVTTFFILYLVVNISGLLQGV